MTKLFETYDELRKDIILNGFANEDAYKAKMNAELTRCFATYGEAKTIKDYRQMVRKYDA